MNDNSLYQTARTWNIVLFILGILGSFISFFGILGGFVLLLSPSTFFIALINFLSAGLIIASTVLYFQNMDKLGLHQTPTLLPFYLSFANHGLSIMMNLLNSGFTYAARVGIFIGTTIALLILLFGFLATKKVVDYHG